jgi:hypothetical protein
MSTTQPTPATEIARDPTDLYDVVVLRSPTVCATCHQRIRDKTEVDPEQSHDGVGTGNQPTAVLERAGAGELGHDCDDVDDYGASKDYYTRTYCAECGRPAGSTPSDTAALETMLDRIPALADALERRGLVVDTDTLYDTVRHLKSQERFAGRDGDIWRAATACAVE